MAVLDAGVAALQLHQPVAAVGDDILCACSWKGEPPAFQRHLVAQILAAGFRTSNPDTIRDALNDVPQPWDHPGHKPEQHRDRKPPWCRECGWTSPIPAVPAMQIRPPKGES